jgi:hypothetical protein
MWETEIVYDTVTFGAQQGVWEYNPHFAIPCHIIEITLLTLRSEVYNVVYNSP